MWPLILQKINTIIESKKDCNIIVLEAAVLLNANWKSHCHEIWVSIIPPIEVNYYFKYCNYCRHIILVILCNTLKCKIHFL